jgi:flagellar basal body rod protein FlgG
MFPQLYTAASGMIAGERSIEISSQNLANVDTPAYQSEHPTFATVLVETARSSGSGSSPAAPHPVALSGAWRAHEPGRLTETGNALDLALESPGFFRVVTPRGERLTRVGQFTRSAEGLLTTNEGYPVLSESGERIALDDDPFSVLPDGTLAGGARGSRLAVVTATPAQLMRDGESLWVAEGAVEAVDPSKVRVRQGYVEGSNVDAVRELTGMVAAQRWFELQQRMLDATGNQLARRALELGEVR